MMLAGLAQSMDATLLTSDRDFEALPEVRTENWLD
jgi:predicted nucleic acid-binding protein